MVNKGSISTFFRLTMVIVAAVLVSAFRYHQAPKFSKKENKDETKVRPNKPEDKQKHVEVINFEATLSFNLIIPHIPADLPQSIQFISKQEPAVSRTLQQFVSPYIQNVLRATICINAP